MFSMPGESDLVESFMFGHVYLILGAFLWEDPDSILQEARSCEDEVCLRTKEWGRPTI